MSRILAAFVVLLLLAGPAHAARSGQDSRVPPATAPAGQTATPPAVQPAAAPDPAAGLPVSLSRIRKELATKPVLKLDLPDADIPRFYVNVNATPDIQTFLKGADLVNGPVPGAPPTFNDMMGLWTPKELYSSAGFDGLSLLTAGAFNAASVLRAQGVHRPRQREERARAPGDSGRDQAGAGRAREDERATEEAGRRPLPVAHASACALTAPAPTTHR